MDIYKILPKKAVSEYARLGAFDWLEYKMGTDTYEDRTIVKKVAVPVEFKNTKVAQLIAEEIARKSNVGLYSVYTLSKAIAQGPKVISLTCEQAQVFEHVNVNVPFSDYQQPYPAIFVEFPTEYRNQLKQRFDHPAPNAVFCYHDIRTNYIFLTCFTFGTDIESSNILPPRPQYKVVEDALIKKNEEGIDLVIAEIVERVALNAVLGLMCFGVNERGPCDPSRYRGLQSAIKKQTGEEREKAKEQLKAQPIALEYIQNIRLYDRSSEGSTGTGVGHVKPHWRRGHFRNQHFGPQLSKTKFIFIKPVFINADELEDDLSQTNVNYKLPKEQ